jgi:hypothetical protein
MNSLPLRQAQFCSEFGLKLSNFIFESHIHYYGYRQLQVHTGSISERLMSKIETNCDTIFRLNSSSPSFKLQNEGSIVSGGPRVLDL